MPQWKTMAAMAAMLALPATWASAGAPVQATAGTPLSSVPIGLEGDPGSLVVASGTTTPARAELDLMWRPMRGEKAVRAFVADRAKLKAAVVMRIESGRQVLVSAPILPGKGRGYASDAKGKSLLVLPTGTGPQSVKVTLTLAK